MDTRLAQGHRVNRLGGFVFGPKKVFWDENERWVLTVHCRPEQPCGVFRIARDDNIDPWVVGEGSFICLAVPETAAGQVGAVRSVNHERTSPGTKGTPAQVAK